MKKTLLIFFIFLSISCFAQFSKTHYIPPLTSGTSTGVSPQDHYLYISTPSVLDVKVKVIEIGGSVFTRSINKNNPWIYSIGSGNDTQIFTPNTTIGKLSNKGYIVEAEDLIYTSLRTNAGGYNQAGGLVSKGNSALGKEFRIGAMLNKYNTSGLMNFASILAVENNTNITISNIPTSTVLTNGKIITGPLSFTLNKNESYVLAIENNGSNFNSTNIIGSLINSDKDIVVNAGSFGGSNYEGPNTTFSTGRDVGFDQIVSFEKTGKEYIFIKGLGSNVLERVLLIAHKDNTKIYVNGNTAPIIKNAGEYLVLDGSNYSNNNLYVTSSENIFAYQSIGGTDSPANQNLFFVPPINCSTPTIVDNIPFIDSIGSISFGGSINVVTEVGATVLMNDVPIPSSPITINANPGFVYYSVNGLSGNVSVKSTKQVYVSYLGTNGTATYGGYYSGFDLKPEIISDKLAVSTTACIPNIILKINELTSYDTFQWFFNEVAIPGATTNKYTPTQSGYYQVRGSILNCGSTVFSDKIPVSKCPDDSDNDGTNNNIDIDLDNDGIINQSEAFSSLINQFNPVLGTGYSGLINGSGSIIGKPLYGFVSEVPAGKTRTLSYTLNLNQSESLNFSYISQDNASQATLVSDYMNSDGDFIVRVPTDKTITVTDPNGQLLIDTNYDGIYESGVKEFSSFEIRFRLNSTTPLVPGTGSFKFQTFLTNSLTFSHSNLSDANNNKATFAIEHIQTFDSDSDGIPDLLDIDSDNDGIPDTIEAQGKSFKVFSGIDSNKNGLDNVFEPGITKINTDNDIYNTYSVHDVLDLDSDNDGIYDLVESGSNAIDANKDGVIDGLAASFGTNGLFDALETSPDSGKLNYIVTDTDSDGNFNYIDLDSDNDLCNDVTEAGFTDPNFDGLLGNNPITINTNGIVKSGTGYTIPNVNYITAAPISITTQPNVAPTCELQNATITLTDNNGNSYQWQIFKGGSWTDIVDDATYAGATTNTLSITSVESGMNRTKYRVQLNKTGNTCGLLSSETILTVYVLPIVNNVTIIQCDDDLNAKTYFNLTVKNELISSNFANENFTYYTSLAGANATNLVNNVELITTPLAFENINPQLPAPQGLMSIWARVTNKITGCYSVAKLTLKVVATNIPVSYNIALPPVCDDFLDIDGNNNANNNKRDGIATFDLSTTKATIEAKLPPLPSTDFYTIKYYRNQADALAETKVITDIANYRNIGYPNIQNIWVRVDSNIDNACYGLGPFVTLTVEALPFANPVIIPRQCDDNQDGKFLFDTSTLETKLLQGQTATAVSVKYFDSSDNPLKDSNGVLITGSFPASFTTSSQTIKAVVTNNTAQKCFDETLITFIVDYKPEAFAIPAIDLTECDDEKDPTDQNGLIDFNTSTLESAILRGQIGMVVTYTLQNGTVLSTLAPTFTTGTQNVLVTVTNPLNPSCPATTILKFVVNSLPNINSNANGDDDELVCSNLPTFYVQLHAGVRNGTPPSNYTYQWKKDGINIAGQTQQILNVNTEGNYTVEVSTVSGCSRDRNIKVTASDIAHLDTIKIIDLVDINSITVNVTGQGQYEYSLDEPDGPFQLSNLFNNVPAGIHEVFINDKNGCGIVSQTIAVLGLPKYFTPNGDGYNDYWSVKGVNSNFNTNSIIFIYDRYGKLITKINTNSEGWDGNFNGSPLPSDDYWYTVKLEEGREAKGHFSLKR
ncbi:T9SS type B sorting domain-containing protein [Flavobacterium sp. ZS1P70]|uniref:T9SS type B sorting domain-containing protein n=1 Tax=Flavobacterium zhoui TaxID=3230414 RepID=A0ABW6I232_9FLAO